jgi:hypothetical protein
MVVSLSGQTEELHREQVLLQKANLDIDQGRERLGAQEARLTKLRSDGRDTRGAERLAAVLAATLVEWERHGVLIQHRVSYLRGLVGTRAVTDDRADDADAVPVK